MSLALCLSGGGLRAALYHLGVLKRLHELDLLHEVQALSAVSGGALTAALFQQSVEGYAAGEDGTPAARIRYEWNHVERCLLKAADAGLLDLYFRSLGLNIMLWLGFGISLLRILLWLWGPAGSHDSILLPALGLVVLGAAGLFLSLLPSALRTLRAQLDEVAQMTKLGGPLETFGKGKSASFREAARLAASPSAMRTATLALRLFDNQLLGQLLTRPQMYLGTIELNRGLEMVFSQWVLAGLNSQGAVALWEQRPGFSDGAADYVYRTYDVRGLPIADAVAASSAYPPFFPPIVLPLKFGEGALPAAFSDGGILDNAALNVLFSMFSHCSERRGRYTKEVNEFGRRPGRVGFSEVISHVLIADAGAPPTQRLRVLWPGWLTLRRAVDIMFASQTTIVANLADVLRQHGEIGVTQISHWIEFPPGHPLCDTELAPLLGRVRTHFDRFDAIETALLVYSGYFWTDQALAGRGRRTAACKGFAEISREVTGTDEVAALAPQELCRHLRFSHLRWSLLRRAGRVLARWRAHSE